MKADIVLTNKQKFSLEIARLSSTHGIDTLEAIMMFVEINECDVMDIVPVIDRSVKEKLWECFKDSRAVLNEDVARLF